MGEGRVCVCVQIGGRAIMRKGKSKEEEEQKQRRPFDDSLARFDHILS